LRLFIAFGVSEEAKEELKKLQKEFKEVGSLKFVKDFHCTLKFLGNVSDKEKNEVVERLEKIKFKPFEVCLDKLGVFPDENFIRVLWVGLKGAEKSEISGISSKAKDKVNDLQGKIDSCLKDVFKKEEKFHAHVTLGRVKSLKDKENFLKLLKQAEVRKICFRVEKMN